MSFIYPNLPTWDLLFISKASPLSTTSLHRADWCVDQQRAPQHFQDHFHHPLLHNGRRHDPHCWHSSSPDLWSKNKTNCILFHVTCYDIICKMHFKDLFALKHPLSTRLLLNEVHAGLASDQTSYQIKFHRAAKHQLLLSMKFLPRQQQDYPPNVLHIACYWYAAVVCLSRWKPT